MRRRRASSRPRSPAARAEQLDLGLHAVFLDDCRRQRAALVEQRREAQHFLPVLRAALGAQLHARRGDVPRARAAQAAQRVARAREIALIEREFRLRQQPRRMQRFARALGALEPPVAPLEFVHLVRGARRDQRRDSARRARFPGKGGFALRARIAPLEVALQRRRQRALGLRALAPFPEAAHLRRQRQRAAHDPGKRVGDGKRRRQAEQREQQRDFDAPGRNDDEQVALADAARDGERDGRGEHRDQPEQRLYHAPRPSQRIRTVARGAP